MFISSLVNDIVKVDRQNYAGTCKRFQLIYIVVVTFSLCLYFDFVLLFLRGAVAWLVRSTPVRALAGDIVLCSCASLNPGV